MKNILFIGIIFLLAQCKPADLRSKDFKKDGLDPEHEAKGKTLLKEAVEAQNLSKLSELGYYQVKATDYWNKMMGMNMNPWPGENGALQNYQFAFNTFDSKITWLEGELEGTSYGIQSWQLYQQTQDSLQKIEDKKLNFMLPTMHYFMELPYRLLNAPIVSYMGQEKWNGVLYHRVFVAWDSPEPNEHDQYILYIHPGNKRVERATYTIRDNFMWTPKNFYGTAVYSNYKEVDGVILPHKMQVYMMDKTHKKPVHVFEVKSVKFETFGKKELYPFTDLPEVGDAK